MEEFGGEKMEGGYADLKNGVLWGSFADAVGCPMLPRQRIAEGCLLKINNIVTTYGPKRQYK